MNKTKTLLIFALLLPPASMAEDLAVPKDIAEAQDATAKKITPLQKFLDSQVIKTYKADSPILRIKELKRQYKENKDVKLIAELNLLAKRKFVDAIRFIGTVYDQGGPGIEKNPELAVKYFWQAAKLKDQLSMYNLGVMALNGRGMKQNLEYAKAMFISSQGLTASKVQLGLISEDRKDIKQSMEHYRSITLGIEKHPAALYKIGRDDFINGKNKKDKIKGINTLRDAANVFDSDAQRLLVDIYYNGIFLPENKFDAAFYMMALKANTNTKAKHLKNLPTIELSEADIKTLEGSFALWIANRTPQPEKFDYSKTFDELAR